MRKITTKDSQSSLSLGRWVGPVTTLQYKIHRHTWCEKSLKGLF